MKSDSVETPSLSCRSRQLADVAHHAPQTPLTPAAAPLDTITTQSRMRTSVAPGLWALAQPTGFQTQASSPRRVGLLPELTLSILQMARLTPVQLTTMIESGDATLASIA